MKISLSKYFKPKKLTIYLRICSTFYSEYNTYILMHNVYFRPKQIVVTTIEKESPVFFEIYKKNYISI